MVFTGIIFSFVAYAKNPNLITIDYAYYNPVSLLMKDRGSLEREFEKDNIKIRWVLSLGSNKALEYLNGVALILDLPGAASVIVNKWHPHKSHICLFKTRVDYTRHK